MKQSLKNYAVGAVIALITLVVGFGGYKGYVSYQQTTAVYQFLAEPIARNDKGEVITRADVLATIAKRVTDAANPTGNAEPTGNVPTTPPKGAGTP